MEKILVVEDEDTLRHNMAWFLTSQQYQVESLACGSEVAPLLARRSFDIVISDILLGDMDGLDVLRHTRAVAPATDVLIMTAYGSVESAVEAFRAGACDYLLKPFALEEVESKIRDILRCRKLFRENIALRQQIHCHQRPAAIVGESLAMGEMLKQVEQVAQVSSNVLITGESGTGKELIARAIRDLSSRKDAPFVPLNVAAIPENLIESYLFGHRRGAFTGADRAREGLFRTAADGTLFLDEIGELPLMIQPKLLRALEGKEILPVGSDVPVKVNTRVIAATHRDLEEMVEQGSFRRDLLFRLNAVEVRVPPLRERMEDIPALVQHFIERHCREAGKPLLAISNDAMQCLLSYAWSKGNVRELSNTIERMVIFCEGDTIHIENLPENIRASETPGLLNLCQAVQEFESRHIASVLTSVGGDREMAAKALGVSRATLYRHMQRLQLWERALPSAPEPRY